jgi:TolA-binding protein
MGNLDLAKNYLKRVIEQFPYSREASLAKVRLAEMKE